MRKGRMKGKSWGGGGVNEGVEREMCKRGKE